MTLKIIFAWTVKQTYDHLLSSLEPHITKKDTVMRNSIPAVERLIATIQFLAT
jgi:hypothetical protein